MKRINLVVISALVGLSTAGCSFYVRSPEEYSEHTKNVIETKKAEIKACYDEVLDADPDASGKVTVNFSVEPKTGAFTNITVDEEATTASEPLQNCLTSAMEGLVLDPPDQQEGVASFTFEFKPQG